MKTTQKFLRADELEPTLHHLYDNAITSPAVFVTRYETGMFIAIRLYNEDGEKTFGVFTFEQGSEEYSEWIDVATVDGVMQHCRDFGFGTSKVIIHYVDRTAYVVI